MCLPHSLNCSVSIRVSVLAVAAGLAGLSLCQQVHHSHRVARSLFHSQPKFFFLFLADSLALPRKCVFQGIAVWNLTASRCCRSCMHNILYHVSCCKRIFFYSCCLRRTCLTGQALRANFSHHGRRTLIWRLFDVLQRTAGVLSSLQVPSVR